MLLALLTILLLLVPLFGIWGAAWMLVSLGEGTFRPSRLIRVMSTTWKARWAAVGLDREYEEMLRGLRGSDA